MEEVKVRHFKVLSLPTGILKKNSIYYVKGTTDTTVKTYITDLNGVPTPLNDQQTKRLTELLDFPDSYTGQAGKVVVVKEDETGTEFKIIGDSSSITEWTQEDADESLYDIGTFVSHNSKIWKSLINNNTDEPSLLSDNWEAQSVENFIGAILTEDVVWSNPDLGKSLPFTSSVGTNLTQLWKQLTQKTFYPTIGTPAFSLSNNAGLREIGSSSSFSLTFNYTRGNITGKTVGGVWQSSTFQNFVAGPSISYTLAGTTQSGNVLTVAPTISQGINTFTGTVTYDIGLQPVDSAGANYLTPYPAGTSPVQSTNVEGVYPLFATITTLVTPNVLPLYSMLSGNSIVIDLIAENDGNKQFIEIPQTWLVSRPLQSIQYFNPVSNQYDTSNKISDFAIANTTKTILGNTINYVRYTNISPDRGTIKIKLLF